MIHRIFAPDRFSLRVIAEVLKSAVPVQYRCDVEAPKSIDANLDSMLLAKCIRNVLKCCVRWSDSKDFGATASGGDSLHERDLKCQARAFLRFIELCQEKSDLLDGFTAVCLQRPSSVRSTIPSTNTNTNTSDNSIAIAVSRQSLAFTYLTIPVVESRGGAGQSSALSDSASTSACVSPSRTAGRSAMDAVSLALSLQSDLCAEMDVTIQKTFRENTVLDCRNLCWLSSSITEMAAAVQSCAPAVLVHLQSALPADVDAVQRGSSRGWLLDCLSDVDQEEGNPFGGSICHHDEPAAQLNITTTTAATATARTTLRSTHSNGSSSVHSREFLRAASRISRSKILCFYREARVRAVLLSVLSACGGSLHSSVSSHVALELLPQVRNVHRTLLQ